MAGQSEKSVCRWDDSLSTGVRLLDEQHIALFTCLEDLERAAELKAMLATFHAMEQLSRYVRDHFSAEERLMKLSGYPGLAEHMREHRCFSDKLFELRKVYLDHDISADLIEFMRGWLEDHVANTDMAYVPYLATEPLRVERAFTPTQGRAARPVNLLEW